MHITHWWPFSLSPRLEKSFTDIKNRLTFEDVLLNTRQNTLIISRLAEVMAHHVPEIIERDGLPYLCHIMNGWGNVIYNEREMIDELLPFIHRNESDAPFILQCEPEGDFHPWQTFAYVVMAGVSPDKEIAGTGITIKELARNSRHINIKKDQGQELGHLLYALSYIDPDSNTAPFVIENVAYNLQELMEKAVHAHKFGTFEVCRKVHLTEGLCTISANVPEFAHYKPVAEVFLNGQLDILFLLCIAMEEAKNALENNVRPSDDSLLREVRNELKIADFLENNAFYIGHLAELAALATKAGYKIRREHINALNLAVNTLNEIIPRYLPYLFFEDCFLHFGHYRRGVSLLEAVNGVANGDPSANIDLAAYTANLDTLTPFRTNPAASGALSAIEKAVFKLSSPVNHERERFNTVLEHYIQHARHSLEPRGRFKHFRRIGPPSWPRSFHYEFLDYGDKIGLEIHIESDTVKAMTTAVEHMTARVQALFSEQPVEWDPLWYKNKGRLRILFNDQYPEPQIAEAMEQLISETFDAFDPIASHLRIAQ
ncbi:hypothetical protein [Chitinophaga sancti]|uniref:Uncharacterized protein n=1 Tax=Chitinophaga sancti TaxID=1004 RepID=A0A1K1M5Q2_9BACT|nr:hypothetical protein [Chitinophaga sancti]WQD64616.1 hypothetical protein U0033_09430 [Chitinophaga sancti]WQG89760.1 hypothetical protein SR876_33045 [Chitinophaga sancti]SFW18407.1 hypothetical protein SAMN05661012_00467 [Chitinophaga sancti]